MLAERLSASVDDLERGRDVNRGADRPVDRAAVHVMVEGALERSPVGIRIHPQHVANVNPFDHEDLVLRLDLTGRLADQPAFARRDMTRLQRASERTR
jgi:hypothetical protein